MNATLWAMLACFLAGQGARDQMLVARLTAQLGRHRGLLLIAVLTGAITSAVAAWATGAVPPQMSYPARLVLISFALIAGGLESLIIRPQFQPKEPTRSLFAAALVLVMQQGVDTARFLVLGIALLTHAPLQAAVGGAAGTGIALLIGWQAAEIIGEAQARMVLIRRGAGLLLLLAGLGLGLWIWLKFGA